MTPTREDLELYVMGAYDGDVAELERAIAADRTLADTVAREAELELLLREAGAAATFCPGCRDLIASTGDGRCDGCGAAARPGGYVVERVLVSNAHGRMYVARDADGKRVALKELAFVQSPSPAVVAAFEREGVLLRALEHPRIPRFCAAFEEGRGFHVRYYLAQELVDGTPLDERLADHFYAEAEIVDIARQVLEVLVYLQGLSPIVVHRDIKPANILMRSGGQLAVVDFGAAHVQGTTAGSTTIGTFGYMPIEQLAGQVDGTTDVYALGATLLHLLTRREPWRFLQGTADLDGINVSAPMRAFLTRLVMPEPRDRFPSAVAALAALEEVAAGRSIVPVPVVAKRRRALKLTPYLGILAAALALVGLGAGGYALVTRGGSSTASGPMDVVLTPAPPRTRAERLIELNAAACSCRELTCIESVASELQYFAAAPQPSDVALLGSIGRCLSEAGKHVKEALAPGPGRPAIISDGAERGERWLAKIRDAVCACTDMACVERVQHKLGRFPEASSGEDRAIVEEMMQCVTAVAAGPGSPVQRMPSSDEIDVQFTKTPLHDVLRTLAEGCKVNLVVPDRIDAKIDVRLRKVPCDQAFEVVLEAHGLWYEYEPSAKLVRIALKRELDQHRRDEIRRHRQAKPDQEQPPAGGTVDLDFKDAPLQDLVALIAAAGKVNIVLPEHLAGAKVTIRARGVPWRVAFEATLNATGLWYRYRPAGKIASVALRREIDAELFP